MQAVDIEALNQQIYADSAFIERLNAETAKVIVAQERMIERLMIGLLSRGHVLLEGLPGLAKTLAISTLSKAVNAEFSRIQFTPDLLPADIIGTMIYNPSQNEFSVRKGPVFANFVLADEINRAPAKVQSALLEAMQERQVTIGNETFLLEEPFLVLATQNPIEQEGTYPLPEAQLDRFMFNIPLDYPSYEEEIMVVKGTTTVSNYELSHVVSGEQIKTYQQLIRKIPIADNVLEYAVTLATQTRPNTARASEMVNDYVSWGAGPRASQYLVLGAKCNAAIKGKYSPDIEDVQAIAKYVLRHRMVRNYKAEAEGITEEHIIESLF